MLWPSLLLAAALTSQTEIKPAPIAEFTLRDHRGAERRLSDWRVTNTFEIYKQWRHRYAPGVTYNTEHVFGLALPRRVDVTLAPREHTACAWLPWREAAERCFSWSNRDAIVMLGERAVIS